MKEEGGQKSGYFSLGLEMPVDSKWTCQKGSPEPEELDNQGRGQNMGTYRMEAGV